MRCSPNKSDEISERIAHGLKLPRRDALRALCLTTPLRGPVFFSKSDCARRDVRRLLEAVPEIRERRLVEELGAESEISREGIVTSTVFTGQLLTACHESVSIKSMG